MRDCSRCTYFDVGAHVFPCSFCEDIDGGSEFVDADGFESVNDSPPKDIFFNPPKNVDDMTEEEKELYRVKFPKKQPEPDVEEKAFGEVVKGPNPGPEPGQLILYGSDPEGGTITPSPASESHGIKDSGDRTEFETGAVRDARIGKGRFDLMPFMALFRKAKHFENGCLKYGNRNWEKGIPISKYVDSAIRHLFKFILGFQDENHLTAASWNVDCAMETMDRIMLGILPNDLNDLPYTYGDIDHKDWEAMLEERL